MTGAEKVAANLGTPVISFPVAKTSELQLKKTKTNSFKKAEDQNISSFMSAESPVLNRNETFSSELNLPSGPRKAGDNSKVVNFSQATLVSPVPQIYILSFFISSQSKCCGISSLSSLCNICFVYLDCGGFSVNI